MSNARTDALLFAAERGSTADQLRVALTLRDSLAGEAHDLTVKRIGEHVRQHFPECSVLVLGDSDQDDTSVWAEQFVRRDGTTLDADPADDDELTELVMQLLGYRLDTYIDITGDSGRDLNVHAAAALELTPGRPPIGPDFASLVAHLAPLRGTGVDNAKRANFARLAVLAYRDASHFGADMDSEDIAYEVLSDLFGDLRHYLDELQGQFGDAAGLDLESLSDRGWAHWHTETHEEGE